MTANSIFQQATIGIDIVALIADVFVDVKRHVPVLFGSQFPIFVDFKPVARHQLANSIVEGLGAREIAERQILGQRRSMEFRRNLRVSENHLDFRTEQKSPWNQPVIEGLDSQAVPRDEQPPRTPIPDRKRKHTAQFLNAFRAILLVKMNDGFRVAMRTEAVAARDQPFPQNLVIVNFAVEDYPDRPVLIADGLVASDQVDDAEAPHSQSDAAFRVDSLIVRPTVRHRCAHTPQDVIANLRVSPKLKDASNSTH